MLFARRVYLIAAIYGLVVILPQVFQEGWINANFPPAITHPEYFYGFVGVVIAWQLGFLVISRDPVRYRPMMPVTVVEKWSWTIATEREQRDGRAPVLVAGFGLIDFVLGVLFLIAYLRTPAQWSGANTYNNIHKD